MGEEGREEGSWTDAGRGVREPKEAPSVVDIAVAGNLGYFSGAMMLMRENARRGPRAKLELSLCMREHQRTQIDREMVVRVGPSSSLTSQVKEKTEDLEKHTLFETLRADPSCHGPGHQHRSTKEGTIGGSRATCCSVKRYVSGVDISWARHIGSLR